VAGKCRDYVEGLRGTDWEGAEFFLLLRKGEGQTYKPTDTKVIRA